MGTYGVPADAFAQAQVNSLCGASPAPPALAATTPQLTAPQPAESASASPAGSSWEAPTLTVLPLR